MEQIFSNYFQNLISETVARELERLLPQIKSTTSDEDRLMTVEELQEYLPEHPARQTIYGWINNRKILYEKHGKRCYFRKSAVDFWINNGRQI